MKKIYFLITAVIILALSSAALFVFASDDVDTLFDDVDSDHENFDAIEYLAENDIINGYADGSFDPDATVNRAEFSKILYEAVFADEPAGQNCFPDVSDEWFAKYVCTLYYKEIVEGYPDGTFRPADPINFVEATKIIINSIGSYSSGDENWYQGYVQLLGTRKAIPASIDSFEQEITRGEMSEIMYRLLANVHDKESMTYDDIKEIELAAGNDVIVENWAEIKNDYYYYGVEEQAYPDFCPDPEPEPDSSDGQYPFVEGPIISYFDDDPIAEAILAGEEVFDMADYDILLCTLSDDPAFEDMPEAAPVEDLYGAKILNGLKQLGYFLDGRCDYETGEPIFSALHQFQSDNGLPESNIVDQATLSALDEQLRAIEERDYEAAKDFVCYEYLEPGPSDNASKDHLAYLYTLTFSMFPEGFQLEKEDCINDWIFPNVSSRKQTICDPGYWPGFNDDCDFININFVNDFSGEDYGVVNQTIENYLRFLSHSIDLAEFYDISFDTSDYLDLAEFYYVDLETSYYYQVPSSYVYFMIRTTYSEEELIEMDIDESEWDLWNGDEQHFLGGFCPCGGSGLLDSENSGYWAAEDDFIAHAKNYILYGTVFRELMEDKPPLQAKYDWIKDNIFEGKEFTSSEFLYDSYFDGISSDIVWDYVMPEPILAPTLDPEDLIENTES